MVFPSMSDRFLMPGSNRAILSDGDQCVQECVGDDGFRADILRREKWFSVVKPHPDPFFMQFLQEF